MRSGTSPAAKSREPQREAEKPSALKFSIRIRISRLWSDTRRMGTASPYSMAVRVGLKCRAVQSAICMEQILMQLGWMRTCISHSTSSRCLQSCGWSIQRRSATAKLMWLSGTNEGQPPVKLYFDEQSGLLLRLVRYADSPLGRTSDSNRLWRLPRCRRRANSVPLDDCRARWNLDRSIARDPAEYSD